MKFKKTIDFFAVLSASLILGSCMNSKISSPSLNIANPSSFPNRVNICRNPTFVGIGIGVAVDINGERIGNLSSAGSKLEMGGEKDDVLHIYVPRQISSFTKKDLVKFQLPEGKSYFMIENKMDWDRGISSVFIAAARSKFVGLEFNTELSGLVNETNKKYAEASDLEKKSVKNINSTELKDSEYIYQLGNWAVKISSEKHFYENCSVK